VTAEVAAAKKIRAAAQPIFKEAGSQDDEEKAPKTGKEKYSAKKSIEDEKKASSGMKKRSA